MEKLLNKSINELEKTSYLANPSEYDSSLVSRCLELRAKPLKDYTVEDLRLMIGQSIGLPWLVPLAIKELASNIFSEGDLYAGDLLMNVLRIDVQYWKSNPLEHFALVRLLEEKLPLADSSGVPNSVLKTIESALSGLNKIKRA
jgi:hypothetical protein